MPRVPTLADAAYAAAVAQLTQALNVSTQTIIDLRSAIDELKLKNARLECELEQARASNEELLKENIMFLNRLE
jgi:FtsZ-binding cell division protein ZapB